MAIKEYVDIFPETTTIFEFSDAIGTYGLYISDGTFSITEGSEYLVIWNGVEYSVTGKRCTEYGLNLLYIGNLNDGYGIGENTGEPFFIFCNYGDYFICPNFRYDETEVTFSIKEAKAVNPNLASLSKLSANNANSTLDGFAWHIVKTGGTDGLIFDTSELVVGETYTFSFKVKKTSGALTVIGGHDEAFTQKKFTIDGVGQTQPYIMGSPVADDTEIHEVVLTSTYHGNASTKNLYFQPNRKLSKACTCDVWDIKMEVGETATAWIPAEEDVDTYTITYETAYGTAPNAKTVTVNVGEVYTLTEEDLPTLEADGYVFKGWSLSVGDTISADTVLTAIWEEIESEAGGSTDKFPLKAWLTGFALGIVADLMKEKEPIAYLYNGVLLPPLPERDMEEYKYVFMHIYNGTHYYELDVVATKTPNAFVYHHSERTFCIGWGQPHIRTSGNTFLTFERKFEWKEWNWNSTIDNRVIGDNDIIWSNYDICYEDGSVYVKASEPIPVYE